MAEVTLKPAFQSAKADTADSTKIGSAKWNASREFGAGTLGDLLYRDTGATTGASWLASAQGVPYWAGAGQAPTVTMTPTLTGVVVGDGVVGTPALRFGTDLTLGLSRYGSLRMAVNSNGGYLCGFDGANVRFVLRAIAALAWTNGTVDGGAADLFLYRDGAGVLAQQNGTNAQKFRLYGTYTDASNYERGALNMGGDYVELAAETAGTGDDDLDVRLTPAGAGKVRFGTHAAIGAETVTGYIIVKDTGGTTRKLAVLS